MSVRILQGDCRTVLSGLAPESVHCVVTSPPYFGLRDYGVDGQIGLEQTVDEYERRLMAITEKDVWEYCPRCSCQRGAHNDIPLNRLTTSLPESCPSPVECRHELALIVEATSAAERGVHGGRLL